MEEKFRWVMSSGAPPIGELFIRNQCRVSFNRSKVWILTHKFSTFPSLVTIYAGVPRKNGSEDLIEEVE
jgi:hypothetical protein